MNSQDPLQALERHYHRLQEHPVPPPRERKTFSWWEVAGGMSAGAAAVIAAVLLTQASPQPAPSGAGLLQHQMRMVGLQSEPAAPPKRAEGEVRWHV